MKQNVFLERFSATLFLTGLAAFVFGSLLIYLDGSGSDWSLGALATLVAGSAAAGTLWYGRRRAVASNPESAGPLCRPRPRK